MQTCHHISIKRMPQFCICIPKFQCLCPIISKNLSLSWHTVVDFNVCIFIILCIFSNPLFCHKNSKYLRQFTSWFLSFGKKSRASSLKISFNYILNFIRVQTVLCIYLVQQRKILFPVQLVKVHRLI